MQKKMEEEKQISQSDLLPLTEAEIELIYLIRYKHRYGSVEILTHDGKPIDVVRVVSKNRLGRWDNSYPQK